MSVHTLQRRSAPPDRFDRRLILPMVLGTLLNPINSSMLAVALVPIGIALGAPPAQTVWLVSALDLATAIGQPVAGRLVDLYGPKRIYLVGTALVGIAGLAGAFAPDLGVLIGARVLLGFGTCAGYPAAMSLIRLEGDRTGVDRPAGVLAVLSVVNQVTAVIGPTLGGVLIGAAGWRAIFTVNLPLAIACVVLGGAIFPRDAKGSGGGLRRLDLPGMALFTVLLCSLMVWLMDPAAGTWWLLLPATAAGWAFVVRERRVPQPFIDVRLLATSPALLATYVRQLLSAVVMYAMLYGFTQWLEAGYGLTPTATGLVVLPLFASAIAVTAITGRHAAVRAKLLVGSSVQLTTSLVLLVVGTSSPIVVFIGIALLLGVPQGLLGLANQNALYAQVGHDRIASAAGLLRTFAYLGAIGASAANAAAFRAGATTAGLHLLGTLLVGCSVALLLLVLLDRSLARIGRPVPPAGQETSG